MEVLSGITTTALAFLEDAPAPHPATDPICGLSTTPRYKRWLERTTSPKCDFTRE